MKTKEVKLSAKRGGHGHITSYTVNLGSSEVRECGFLREDSTPFLIEKILDPENNQIILRPITKE